MKSFCYVLFLCWCIFFINNQVYAENVEVKKSFAYPGIPTCKIVDIYKNDPFKKFDKYKIKEAGSM